MSLKLLVFATARQCLIETLDHLLWCHVSDYLFEASLLLNLQTEFSLHVEDAEMFPSEAILERMLQTPLLPSTHELVLASITRQRLMKLCTRKLLTLWGVCNSQPQNTQLCRMGWDLLFGLERSNRRRELSKQKGKK
jgi:hypothetical protein